MVDCYHISVVPLCELLREGRLSGPDKRSGFADGLFPWFKRNMLWRRRSSGGDFNNWLVWLTFSWRTSGFIGLVYSYIRKLVNVN
ncbi:MAG TPA: hypothetical protein DIT35_01010 [Rhodospirillaceae bacterium]|nr:hypothetical protein [Rhodospirillaceae bacterium]